MTSLAYIFTKKKALVKIIFGHTFFLFVNRFSKFLRHFLGLLGCKKITRSYFVGGVSEQDEMQKGSFQRMV